VQNKEVPVINPKDREVALAQNPAMLLHKISSSPRSSFSLDANGLNTQSVS
jgi:hypothetical protein